MNALSERGAVPFTEELEHLKKYLFIEQMRFGDALKVVYNIETTDFSLPVLTLQPIVENAVKHGIGQREDGGTVVISCVDRGDRIEITVVDDGVGFDPDQARADDRCHIGIENVRHRLYATCGGEIVINSRKNVGTTAIITIYKEV